MNPCPKCGATNAVTFTFAGGKPGAGVACRTCNHKVVSADRTSAVARWDAAAEAAARRAEKAKVRELQRGATKLAGDARFQSAVEGRYVGYRTLNGTPDRTQVMRMPIGGVEHEVNVRAFVEGWLAPQWPELLALRDPEAVVHRALRTLGHQVYEVRGRQASGKYVGKWKRPEPHVGRPWVAETTEAA